MPKRTRKPWTVAELDLMREHGSTMPMEQLAALVNHPLTTVQRRVWLMGLGRTRPDAWTETDDQYMRDNYKRVGAKKAAADLGRSQDAVRGRAVILGVSITLSDLYGARNAVVSQMTPAEEGYVAGIIDGEGTLTIGLAVRANSRASLRPQVIISNTSKPLISWLETKLRFTKAFVLPTVGGFYKDYKCKPAYQTTITGSTCAPLLRALRDKLIIKRELCDRLLEFIELRGTRFLVNREQTEQFTDRERELFWRVRWLNLSAARFAALEERVTRKGLNWLFLPNGKKMSDDYPM